MTFFMAAGLKNIISTILIVSFMGTSDIDTFPNSGYIKLCYQGVMDKPHPLTIFYLPGSLSNPLIDTLIEGFYVHKFEVSEKEFEGIKTTIEENKFGSLSQTAPFDYGFQIIFNKEKKTLFVQQKKQVQQIFENILNQFENPDKKKSIKIWLDLSLKRIPG